jgi:hypothetical protein
VFTRHGTSMASHYHRNCVCCSSHGFAMGLFGHTSDMEIRDVVRCVASATASGVCVYPISCVASLRCRIRTIDRNDRFIARVRLPETFKDSKMWVVEKATALSGDLIAKDDGRDHSSELPVLQFGPTGSSLPPWRGPVDTPMIEAYYDKILIKRVNGKLELTTTV